MSICVNSMHGRRWRSVSTATDARRAGQRTFGVIQRGFWAPRTKRPGKSPVCVPFSKVTVPVFTV